MVTHEDPDALLGRAGLLRAAGKHTEALAGYDEVLQRVADSGSLEDRRRTADALIGKALALGETGRSADEVAVYDQVVKQFGAAPETALRERVAKALVNKAITLGQQGKPDEELAVYDQVVKQFGAAPEPALRERVAKALVYKAITLGKQGKPDEELAVYDQVVKQFGAAPETALREQVAKALVYKAITLKQVGRFADALAVCEEALSHCGAAREAPLARLAARALLVKGASLDLSGKPEDAAAVFTEVRTRFGDLGKPLADEVMAAQIFLQMSQDRPGLAGKGPVSPPAPPGGTELPLDSASVHATLRLYLDAALQYLGTEKTREYFERIEAANQRTERFLDPKSNFRDDLSFLLVLREWNSYTPTIPTETEADRGGGYYIRHGGEGIVIDPGYDFIENFSEAGGRLCDVQHIVLTHAHDDHTADFEAILMLLHRMRGKQQTGFRRVNLYMSTGVQRKFSGLFGLRDERFHNIVTMSPVYEGTSQTIRLNHVTTMTVLPAYHDDVVTKNMAVGLGFEFVCSGRITKLVLTSDTGLYPRSEDSSGQSRFYDTEKRKPRVDTSAGCALYDCYPEAFRSPDVLIVHIGSIRKEEFQPLMELDNREPGEWFYPNHLGALGTLAMIDKLQPRLAIVSEFGAELKSFRIELVERIGKAVHRRQDSRGVEEGARTLVVPGDLTTAYRIDEHSLLCHDTSAFEEPAGLVCRPCRRYRKRWDAGAREFEVEEILPRDGGADRAYLFLGKRQEAWLQWGDDAIDKRHSKDYFKLFYNHRLPYHRQSAV